MDNNQKYLSALRRFVVYVLIILALHDLCLGVLIQLKHLHHIPPSVITAVEVLVISAALFWMIRRMGFPLRDFGLNLDRAAHNILESLAWTAGFCFFLLAVKWLLINHVELFGKLPLFYHPKADRLAFQITGSVVYCLFSFFQVFIVHGALQAPLLLLLDGPRKVAQSVAVTTLVFASLHADMHYTFALLTLLPGLMWSLMYARQRSLLGVGISHALVGLWAFWGLDFYQMMNLAYAHIGQGGGGF